AQPAGGAGGVPLRERQPPTVTLKRATWLDLFAPTNDGPQALTPAARQALYQLDDTLFQLWNLGENVLLAWTQQGRDLRTLVLRHYEIAENTLLKAAGKEAAISTTDLTNYILAGPKHLPPDQFDRVCRLLARTPQSIEVGFEPGGEIDPELISSLVRRYGVTLVKGRAVVLVDAVEFSLYSPLEQ